MKVLYVASEAAPIIKLGGLGDVAGSLPKALAELGVDIDVAVPYFPIANTKNIELERMIGINVPFDQTNHVVEVFRTKLPNSDVDIFLFKNDKFFRLGGINAFANDISETAMFTFFSKAVVEFIKAQYGIYDIVHCNDWHTGLTTHLLSDELGTERPSTLFTIHNLLYQGKGDLDLVNDVGLIPGSHPLVDWDIMDGDINLMLQGITASDYVNAVSPSYAQEILEFSFGKELADVLHAREGRLSGILNGLDYSQFPRYYDVAESGSAKAQAKRKLQEKLDLEVCNKPLFGFVSRLDPGQKGLDILHAVIPELVASGGQFVLLGVGAKDWEAKLSALADSKDVSINIDFDVALALEIYQASDFFVVPSKYEPCGLTQMIAMWYGSLPIVRAVGGLKDSVEDGKTGFIFSEYSPAALKSAVNRAFEVYADKVKLTAMREAAMCKDFSWAESARLYKSLYDRMLRG